MPKDIQCSLRDNKLEMIAGDNEYMIQGGTVDGVVCWISDKGSDHAKEIPLASTHVTDDGAIGTKIFGNLRLRILTVNNRVGSEHDVFSIRRDMVQPLRSFLQQADKGAAASAAPSTSHPTNSGVYVEPGTQLKASSAAATATTKPAAPASAKLPLGVPAPGLPAVKTIKKTAFSLQYQEIEIGTGAAAEPNKMYKVHYTGWLAADGHKFDSSYDHPGSPLKDKDGKPVMGDDGKPKLDLPPPMPFPQGFGRVIPGFDQGFEGMKIGGKRRIFIPWQLAYGAKGKPGPDAANPGIPPKADLIFDVELVDVSEMPAPPQRPPMGGMRPMPGAPSPGAPGAPALNVKLPDLGTTPKPPAPGAAPNAAAPSTPAPNAAPAPAAAPKPAAPAATAPAPSATPAAPTAPQPK
jgi:peptidylprolyl isomerase